MLALDIKSRIDDRRMKWIGESMRVFTYEIHSTNNREKILTFIDRHTSGEFYLAGDRIGFSDERDTLIFKLGYNGGD